MNKKTLFLILLAVLVLPSLAFAQVTVVTIVDAAVATTLYIAGGIIVILWVVTGILFLTAQGAPEKLNLAKKALFASVVGTALIILAGSAISLVGSVLGI